MAISIHMGSDETQEQAWLGLTNKITEYLRTIQLACPEPRKQNDCIAMAVACTNLAIQLAFVIHHCYPKAIPDNAVSDMALEAFNDILMEVGIVATKYKEAEERDS